MTTEELERVGRLVLRGASERRALEFLRECALVDLQQEIAALERCPGHPGIRQQIEDSYERMREL